MSALDAALRDVIAAARTRAPDDEDAMLAAEPQLEVQAQVIEETGELTSTIDVVTRAATTIDQLIERNRSVTEAAVRSVEYFRAQAAEAREEADRLRAETQAIREENEALKAAALAHAEELEAELEIRTRELEAARSWIEDIRSHVESLLGNVEARLSETPVTGLFEEK